MEVRIGPLEFVDYRVDGLGKHFNERSSGEPSSAQKEISAARASRRARCSRARMPRLPKRADK